MNNMRGVRSPRAKWLANVRNRNVLNRLEQENSSDKSPKLACKSIKVIFFVVAVLSAAFTIRQVSEIYFSYTTVTEIVIKPPANLGKPSITICAPFVKLIPRYKLYEWAIKNSPSILKRLQNGLKLDSTHVQNELTIEDIFELTPRNNSIIESCTYRKPGDLKSFIEYTIHCNSSLVITKYLFLHNICYQVSFLHHIHVNGTVVTGEDAKLLLRDSNFNYHNMRYHILTLDAFLEVSLKADMFTNVTSFVTNYSPINILRGYDMFRVKLKRSKLMSRSKSYKQDYYFLSFQEIYSELLPSPFPTSCRNYTLNRTLEKSNRAECVDMCINVKVREELDTVPFTTKTYDSNLSMKIISNKNLKNCQFRARLKSIEKKCIAECGSPDCTSKLFVTKYLRSQAFDADHRSQIKFRMLSPIDRDLSITFFASTTLNDYLADVLNCIGVCLGFCVFDLTLIVGFVMERARKLFGINKRI